MVIFHFIIFVRCLTFPINILPISKYNIQEVNIDTWNPSLGYLKNLKNLQTDQVIIIFEMILAYLCIRFL